MNRDDFERRRAERRHALNFLEFAVLDEAGGVITSYSIHYTKLYERRVLRARQS